MDHQTRRNLEITQTSRDGTYNGSLLWALGSLGHRHGGAGAAAVAAATAADVEGIQHASHRCTELVDNGNLRQDLQQQLKQIYDLERLAGRAGSGTANGGTW
jgi:DNA mismatch repair protein MutS